ncbi:MAG: hypothetical protein APR62_06240 [Smithella sp. SDB]|nr:MAG: hypothetical protein APR62_06240 [Smithella sp. SDB]
MSFIQTLLVHIPSPLLCCIMVFIYVSISISGLLIIRKYYPHYKCKPHNDIAGFIFATLGVVYAVLLAFTVIITWQDFDKAQDVTVNEANCIEALYLDSIPFPAEFRAELKNGLTNYVRGIINDEWQVMANGRKSPGVQKIQEKLWELYGSFQPQNETQKIFLMESVKKFNQAEDMRRRRIVYASTGINPILYFVLITGSFITIAFAMLFGTENIIPHLIMVSLLAALIAITLFTTIAMDYPFTGDVSIKPDVFINTLSSLIKA